MLAATGRSFVVYRREGGNPASVKCENKPASLSVRTGALVEEPRHGEIVPN